MTAPLVLSCGDPSGIGPELAAKAWAALRGRCPFAWIGDPAHLPAGTPICEIDDLTLTIHSCAEALPVLSHPFPAPALPGQPDPANAASVVAVLDRAVDLVRSGQASGLCTAPINKQVLIEGAGFGYPGHTEYLAAQAGVDRVVMMLAGPELRVVPATIHIALSDVPKTLTPALLREVIEITAQDLTSRFGIAQPRIAVAALNPHAGEGGAMGTEEDDWITALIQTMAGEGHALTGPHPADTLFHAAARQRYDAAIAMYHDQALIPIKTLDFDMGVNVTLGLPFIRTSPDHGTAYDIAGQNLANPTSLIEALKLAQTLARA